MSGTSEKKPRRPFHETIVDQIQGETSYAEDLDFLGQLIMVTKIPKNHDAIIAAWQERCDELAEEEDPFFAEVLADLLQQKQEAEAEAKAKEAAQREWSGVT
ncbi:MAG: hypothetical protein AAB529_03070 [Patescibacteria group bacterium]